MCQHVGVLCGWESGCEVLLQYGAFGGKHADKQSRRHCALGRRKAVALVDVLGMWRSLEEGNSPARSFWKKSQ